MKRGSVCRDVLGNLPFLAKLAVFLLYGFIRMLPYVA
jgi:hypothetical protein